jgi:hypothetical protein
MWILIIFGILFLVLSVVIAVLSIINNIDDWFEATFWSFVLSGICFVGAHFVHGGDLEKQFQKTCHESPYLVSPKVVHMSDSSEKFLKYFSKNSQQTISIKSFEGNFFVPESLLFVDTCNNELKIKK